MTPEEGQEIVEFLTVFAVGGAGYGMLELIFRGHTHWSMLIAGGLSFTLYYAIVTRGRQKKWQKWVMGAFVITTVEFVAGAVVNLILGWNVWDYSHLPLSLYGQICILFSVLWFLLCIPACELCGRIRRLFM